MKSSLIAAAIAAAATVAAAPSIAGPPQCDGRAYRLTMVNDGQPVAGVVERSVDLIRDSERPAVHLGDVVKFDFMLTDAAGIAVRAHKWGKVEIDHDRCVQVRGVDGNEVIFAPSSSCDSPEQAILLVTVRPWDQEGPACIASNEYQFRVAKRTARIEQPKLHVAYIDLPRQPEDPDTGD
jgi:hypothetical protein